MRVTLHAVIMAAGLGGGAAAIATAAEVLPDVRLTIRTYDAAAVPESDQRAALAVATDILKAAGLDVEWRACATALVGEPADLCNTPMGRNELAVRFVRLPPRPGETGHVPLGYSLVDPATRAGALATIFVDRVAALASSCAVDVRPLLGRAVAHEIGHLLLGTRDHTPHGLMRAVWSRDALRNDRAAAWHFTQRDASALREAVRARSAERIALR